MADGGITQRISLEGGEEITTKLAEIGKKGEEAFARLKEASVHVRGGFEKMMEPLHELKEKLASVAEVLGIGLVASSGGAVAGFLELVKSSTEAIHGME